jgi:hypothetical protein
VAARAVFSKRGEIDIAAVIADHLAVPEGLRRNFAVGVRLNNPVSDFDISAAISRLCRMPALLGATENWSESIVLKISATASTGAIHELENCGHL